MEEELPIPQRAFTTAENEDDTAVEYGPPKEIGKRKHFFFIIITAQ
ncbi:MAG: hypothetical protein JSY10_25410 [Paenibacillus sp.]|nr:hypothetical protein [Paenibacillus sp.]